MTRADDMTVRERGAVAALPVAEAERFAALDTLRGFALLGILAMNVQAFSMPMSAYVNPTSWGDLSGPNLMVWGLVHVLADQKMMTIFSMLFGAGIALFADRVAARGRSPVGLHYRRSAWLLLFGAAHAYLLWFGDVLFLYAVCAMAVFWLRRLSPGKLFVLGALLLSVSSLLYLAVGWSMQFWPPEQMTGFVEESWQPPVARQADEVVAYRGGWLAQMAYRAPAAFAAQTFMLLFWGVWRAAGLMLIGMGLYRSGVLTAQSDTRTYVWMIAAALLAGLPLVAFGMHWNFANDWGPSSMFFGSQFNYWGSVPMSLGWIAVVMLACRYGVLAALRTRLAAVGRLALSNYILQTVLCTLVFYGTGFGLFGQVERVGQCAVVLAVWLLQLWLSPVWLRHFRQGPLEWLWRSLTYGQRQPLRRA